ncbi:MAG: septal ring lytic transglycosylase RlpA family lipoprotein [Candidatus Melainabacteria bacterium HGW-Melainabacteria-1]|nr:MAG: septal ring lytic transglycosylase RlpA family lipoprotein [Candidatus Melainabacteria bacterium HGW-Melainabacteria-1]
MPHFIQISLMSLAALLAVGSGAGSALATLPVKVGLASYYGPHFHGKCCTASGETVNMHALTAAHRTLPFGSRVQVTNLANQRTVVVRINDRGPFHGNRIIDLSKGAFDRIARNKKGVVRVRLKLLSTTGALGSARTSTMPVMWAPPLKK